METFGIVVAMIAAAAALRFRQLALPVLLALGVTALVGYALSFSAFLDDGRIEMVDLIRFALATAALGLVAARLPWLGAYPALLAGAAVLVLHGRVFQNYLVDDAFISFRYAQNLAAGHGVVWNIGEHVEGYTNFLWVLLLTPFEKLAWNVPEASRWLGLIAAAAAWPIGFAMLREWSRGRAHEGGLHWAQAAYALALPTCGAFTMWTFGGLETTLFASLVLASTFLMVREDSQDYRGPPWSAVALLLLALTRFDGLLLFPMAAALRAWALVRSRERDDLTRFLTWLAVFAAPYAVYFGWRYAYYGYPLPNSFYAKVEPSLSATEQIEQGIRYVSSFAQDYGAVVIVPALISLAGRWPLRQAAYVAAVIVGWAAYVAFVGGDFMVQGRFLAPLVPLVYVLAADGAVSAFWALRERVDQRVLAGGATVALLGVIAVNLAVSDSYIQRIRYEAKIDSDRVKIGKWLRDNVPADYVVLVDPAGAIPYYSHLRTIDNLGINDETIAHTETQAPGMEKVGHEKSNAAYILSRRPDIYVEWHGLAPTAWDKKFWQTSTSPTRAGRDFLQQPETFDLYEPQSVQLDGGWFNYLELRDEARVGG